MTNKGTIGDLGEEGLLRLVTPLLERQTSGFPLPTGDDVAISPPPPPGFRQVWTVDSMIEGTHFRWWKHPLATPRALGHKLAASNLSDLASKGATPQYALLSLGLPREASTEAVTEFLAGLVGELENHGANLVGGDTVASPVWTLTLTLTGLLKENRPIAARHRAQPGQNVYITGAPGESGAGFRLLEQGHPADDSNLSAMVRRHLLPTPRVGTGAALLRFSDIAMIDISDGLAHDARVLATRSAVSIVFDGDRLPLSGELAHAGRFLGIDPMEFVYNGGEDFELLFATGAPEEEVLAIDPQIRRIGRVEAGGGLFIRGSSGVRPLEPAGFEHFQAGKPAPGGTSQ